MILAEQVVAIDSGLLAESFRLRYGQIDLQPPSRTPIEQMTAAGLKREDVTHLLLTHGHYDHSGGMLDGSGEKVFPRAEIVIHAKELAQFADIPLDSDSFYDGLVAEHLQNNVLQLLAEDSGQVAGIGYQLTGGHTPGHVVYHCEGVVFGGDLLPVASSVRNGGPQESDSDPALAASWRNRLRQGEFGSEFFLCHGSSAETTFRI
jgi:glyoxylase-like metal-dependent hydrolase (beta-lactamase superfamily II)